MTSHPVLGERSARERILDAALEEFGATGYRGAATRSIASKAGVNEVTVFRHFGSKANLFRAVFEERSVLGEVSEGVSLDFGGDMEEVLYRNMRFVLGLLRRNRSFFLMLLGDAPRMPELRGVMKDIAVHRAPELMAPTFQALMEGGRLRPMDPKVAVRAMMGMVQAYFIMEDLLGDGEVDEGQDERMLRGFASIFLDGARAREG